MALDIKVPLKMATGKNDANITLRDLFAAAALAGLNAHHDNGLEGDATIVADAWRLADAMLVARDNDPGATNPTTPVQS